MSGPPEEGALRDWLRPHLGEVALRPCPGAHGRVQTWEVRSDAGRFFLRWGRSPRKHRQELQVARTLWPLLGACPTLVAADDRGLLMTACPGGPDRSPAACRRAGALARRLHGLPMVDDDPLPLDAALQARLRAARDRLTAHGERLPPSPPLPPTGPRRWCHRDLVPENWCFDGETTRLVDWEHARPDWPILDLARLAALPCWPDVAQGYGPVDPAALRFALFLHGAGTLAWGLDHGDAAFASEGRRVLSALADGSLPSGG